MLPKVFNFYKDAMFVIGMANQTRLYSVSLRDATAAFKCSKAPKRERYAVSVINMNTILPFFTSTRSLKNGVDSLNTVQFRS